MGQAWGTAPYFAIGQWGDHSLRKINALARRARRLYERGLTPRARTPARRRALIPARSNPHRPAPRRPAPAPGSARPRAGVRARGVGPLVQTPSAACERVDLSQRMIPPLAHGEVRGDRKSVV